ncbi:MAG: hypothetical protein JRG91_21425, partial [Deltaproteobacteria bacterium]|nr:hypothetical protein [Deltaproteobacteria bacterium]
MKRIVVTAAACAIALGCVSQEEYESALKKIKDLESQVADLEDMRNFDQERIDELSAENSTMANKLEQM